MNRYEVNLADVTSQNVKQLKRLNQTIFPISYNEKFYKDVLSFGKLAQLAYLQGHLVGAVCGRVEDIDGSRSLYVMTLGVLGPYRRYGVGSAMLKHVTGIAVAQKCQSVRLHVQTNNEEACHFYERFGFTISGTVENYYRRATPPDAYVLQKLLTEGELVSTKRVADNNM